ncbi:helix-turn-helix domain-containing protein [Solimonas sp. SE-A11]|uniref:helix-turn-helix domain-containing protein n=1 Tax=Solimonas sp. SE-A11 TaxID=3054954 RepID=UPI00259CD163|nr:helix-turn-helix transcriptional regulator [Solimonas sp. SE-A11]MDM4772950.1 helix-turn-helix transcriptional regulator [Solimonas sp. SE-A11]
MQKKRKPSTLNKLFGVNVKLERTRLGITQEELALRIKTEQPYLSKVERGVVASSLDFVERIAKALNVKPVDLLDENLGRRSRESS